MELILVEDEVHLTEILLVPEEGPVGDRLRKNFPWGHILWNKSLDWNRPDLSSALAGIYDISLLVRDIPKGELERRIRLGFISGALCNALYVTGSIEKACNVISGKQVIYGRAPSPRELKRIWAEWKSVSHMWWAVLRYFERTGSGCFGVSFEEMADDISLSSVACLWELSLMARPRNAAAHIPWPPIGTHNAKGLIMARRYFAVSGKTEFSGGTCRGQVVSVDWGA